MQLLAGSKSVVLLNLGYKEEKDMIQKGGGMKFLMNVNR